MINVVIPMAGTGERFKCKTNTPKPLIEVDFEPMFIKAVESLGLQNISTKYTFITSTELADRVDREIRNSGIRFYEIIALEKKTEGPACTALLAVDAINNDVPLIIANCDQILLVGSEFEKHCFASKNPFVVTFTGGEASKHSFVEVDRGQCNYFTEKDKISDTALTGIHFWDQGKKFVSSAIKMMIAQDKAPNGEYYVSKSYNYLNGPITVMHVPPRGFYAIGTPEELEHYAKEQEAKINYNPPC